MHRIGIVRRAGIDDAPAISSLIREVAPLAFAGVGTSEQLAQWLNWHACESVIEARLNSNGSYTAIAIDETGEAVGTGYLEWRLDGMPSSVYLGGLYCRARGVGLGPVIIRALTQVGMSVGGSAIYLSVAAKNARMLHVVDTLGFLETGRYVDEKFFKKGCFVTLCANLPLVAESSSTSTNTAHADSAVRDHDWRQ